MRKSRDEPAEPLRPVAETAAIADDGDPAGRFPSDVSGDRRGALWPRLARLAGILPATGGEDEDCRALSGGRQHPSGSRRADGGAVRAPGSAAADRGPGFDVAIPPGGYIWWYFDGLSDDGRHAITVIAFIGSVFSPYYAWAGRRDPLNHCCINVALYGKSGGRWAMTERGRDSLRRDGSSLCIGPSALSWRDADLVIALDEIGAPWPRPVQGEIRLTPTHLPGRAFTLDADGRHVWQPIAPAARLAVTLDRPALSWRGNGYLDSNFGSEPLEAGFREWSWSRAHQPNGTIVLYDSLRRNGSRSALALRFPAGGGVETLSPPARHALGTTLWRISRRAGADAGTKPRVIQTLEDAPFYARSLIDCRLYDAPAVAFHESLSLDRFDSPIVKLMLPFRMPRRFF